MATAKDIHVAPISSQDARKLVRDIHYSGKVVQNSQLHLGVFLNGRCEGAMQFGPSLDKRKIQGLVKDTPWNGFLELNRMAFSEALPKNSESRAIGVAMRIIKKRYPHIQWVISFADGTQCGDGTIYRASGFDLTAINKSMNLVRLPSGEVPTTARPELGGKSYYGVTGGKYDLGAYAAHVGGELIPGFQLRYMYFIDPTARGRLNVPILPFSRIQEMGAGMYRGEKRSAAAVGGEEKLNHGA